MNNKTNPGEIIYRELSYQIMQAVFEVHNTLGPGFTESIYEEALTYELKIHGIPFERQKEIIVHYKQQIVGKHRLDLLVEYHLNNPGKRPQRFWKPLRSGLPSPCFLRRYCYSSIREIRD